MENMDLYGEGVVTKIENGVAWGEFSFHADGLKTFDLPVADECHNPGDTIRWFVEGDEPSDFPHEFCILIYGSGKFLSVYGLELEDDLFVMKECSIYDRDMNLVGGTE